MKDQTPPGGTPIRACRGVFFVGLALALVGCVSPRDIRVLQAQLDELQAEQSRLTATISRLDSLAAGGSGSAREMVVDLKHSVSDMDAQLVQLEARLTDLESRSAMSGSGATVPVVLPSSNAGGPPGATSQESQAALDVYEAAFEALKREDHPAAISGFREYLASSPAGSEAASAHFWIGESQYALGKQDSALVEYQAVIDRFPQSPKVPAALFKAGSIYDTRGDKEKAYPYFRRLKEEFPQSLEYQQLRRQLEE